MTDKLGALLIPVPEIAGKEAIGDPLLGFVGSFLSAVITAYGLPAWQSVQADKPLVKTVNLSDPDDGFAEDLLPGLFLFRQTMTGKGDGEVYRQDAEDYRYRVSKVWARLIFDPMPQAARAYRNNIVGALAGAIDRALDIGRDPAWRLVQDTAYAGADPALVAEKLKSLAEGSDLARWAGFAVLEPEYVGSGVYVRKMIPSPSSLGQDGTPRKYDELRIVFSCDELLVRDLTLIGSPNATLEAHYVAPDGGTGLGSLDLGDAIYE